jgi:hypothetical protein
MAKRKGRNVRGKSRVSQAPMEHIGRPSWATSGELEVMVLAAGDHCPLCAAMGVQLEPSGHARATVRAAVSPVPPATV